MPNKSPAYRWYPRDILGSLRVASMTAAEECWYRRALDFAWLNNGLPADPVKLARIIGKNCTSRGAAIVLQMFVPSPNNPEIVISERQELEREKQKEWSAKSAEGGKRSRPPAKQPETNPEPPLEPNAKQKGTLQFASSESSTEDKKKKAKADKPPRDPRQEHPAIQAYIRVVGKWPLKDLWDEIIDMLGEEPDEPLMKRCWIAWRGKGFSPTNYAWLFEWYLKGGPQTETINGTYRSDNGVKPTNASRIEQTRRALEKFPTEAELAALAREGHGDAERPE